MAALQYEPPRHCVPPLLFQGGELVTNLIEILITHSEWRVIEYALDEKGEV
jgi:hypothetical protein